LQHQRCLLEGTEVFVHFLNSNSILQTFSLSAQEMLA
jgi:hypothetical protein